MVGDGTQRSHEPLPQKEARFLLLEDLVSNTPGDDMAWLLGPKALGILVREEGRLAMCERDPG